MKRQKSPCKYCDRRYITCHAHCYDYFMYRCYVDWENALIQKEKDLQDDLAVYRENKHHRLKHWTRKDI